MRTAALAAATVACGRAHTPVRGDDEAAWVAGGTGSAEVSYQPSVHTVDANRSLAIVRAASRDGWTLAVDANAPELAGLKAGDVLLFKNLTARRVVAADTNGGRVYVLTDHAALGDVVRTGKIRLHAPIRFTAAVASVAPDRGRATGGRLLDVLVPPAYAQKPKKQPDPIKDAYNAGQKALKTGEKVASGVFDGWTTNYSATPGAGRLDLEVTMTREAGPFRAVIKGTGYIADFDLDSGIDVERGVVEQLELASKRMNGVMNFTWQVAADAPDPHNNDHGRIKLPSPVKIPLAPFLGGMPLFIEIGGAVIIEPALTGGKEYSRGAFRVTYDGAQQFSVKKGNIDAEGNVTGDIKYVEGQSISPLAPHGFVMALAAPRVELTLGLGKLNFKAIDEAAGKVDDYADALLHQVLTPEQYEAFKKNPVGGIKMAQAATNAVKSNADAYVELVTSSGASFSGESAIVPCTRTDIHVTVTVGASATAFGQQAGKVSKEVYRKDFLRVDPPGNHLCRPG